MKKSLTIVMTLLAVNAYSANWEDHWIQALKHNEQNNLAQAENELNLSIACLEANSDTSHPYVYLDRGKLLLQQNKNKQALEDLNKALASTSLTKNDKINCLMSRMTVYSNLGQTDQYLADNQEFIKLYDNFPKTEIYDDKIIIRDAPEDQTSQEIFTQMLIVTKMCEKESDIQKFDSVWIINKQKS